MGCRTAAAFFLSIIVGFAFAAQPTAALALNAEEVNAAAWRQLEGPPAKTPDPFIVKAQALLDRRGFSPGIIDGHDGDNFRKAVSLFRSIEGLGEGVELDEPTWRALGGEAQSEVIVNYTVSPQNGAYEFAPRIPADYA